MGADECLTLLKRSQFVTSSLCGLIERLEIGFRKFVVGVRNKLYIYSTITVCVASTNPATSGLYMFSTESVGTVNVPRVTARSR